MFFIGGVDAKMKELGNKGGLVCPACGALSRLTVYKSYSFFHVFFIPTLKWNVKYIAKSSCCAAVLAVPEELGKAFERGETPDFDPASLEVLVDGRGRQFCRSCGAETRPGYAFCPHCGRRLQ